MPRPPSVDVPPERPASAHPSPEVVDAERLTPREEAALLHGLAPETVPAPVGVGVPAPGSSVFAWVRRHPILVLCGATGLAAVAGLVSGIAIALPAPADTRTRQRRRAKRRRHLRVRA